MDEHELALMNAMDDIECLVVSNHNLGKNYTRTYNRAIRHAANSIREIITKYQDMK